MSKSLEDFIKKNKDAFDDREPSEKVWKEIDAALPGMKHKSFWNSVALWRVAAIFFMGLSVYFFVAKPQAEGAKESVSALKLQKDFTSLESFYSSEIANKIAMINDYKNDNDLDQFTQDFQKLDA